MHYIAHRGNYVGRIPEEENRPSYLIEAMRQNYDVEVDMWYYKGVFYLGHDEPIYEIDLHFIYWLRYAGWFHLKSVETVKAIVEHDLKINYFLHQTDPCAVTSRGFIWCHSNSNFVSPKSIIVLPELNHFRGDLDGCAGVCSDNIENYAN